MIASFTRDFIFVKTRKVGGTSLEIVLSAWCEDPDICSPVTPPDERLRHAYGGAARNFTADDGSLRFFNHMPATAIRTALPELWSRAFKFTVERHPYEKVVSRAWWNIGRRGGDAERELGPEIERAIERRSYLNFPLYSDDGAVLVDEVWRYEEMWDRVALLSARIGVQPPDRPPRAKAEHRQDRRPARDVLTKPQRDRIYADARIEFDLLGFER